MGLAGVESVFHPWHPCVCLCSLTTYYHLRPCRFGNAATRMWLLVPQSHWSLKDSWVRTGDSCGGEAWEELSQVSPEWQTCKRRNILDSLVGPPRWCENRPASEWAWPSADPSVKSNSIQRAVKLRILFYFISFILFLLYSFTFLSKFHLVYKQCTIGVRSRIQWFFTYVQHPVLVLMS